MLRDAQYIQAQIVLPTQDLNADMAFFEQLGFRLDQIFPDDNPEVAMMSGHGLALKLDRNISVSPATIHLLTDDHQLLANASTHVAPNGTTIHFTARSFEVSYPDTPRAFEIRHLRDGDPWVIGRAGMQYQDLLPSRLGGSMMASHIRIPQGGPVPDMVHYHTIGFQLIFCYKGWVKLVYEDQGPPFILGAGDCVTQPPQIRHRVLEASDNLEVIEIGIPAVHMTTIDHEMELPTDTFDPDREFGGQVFCHHKSSEAVWQSWHIPNFDYRDTGIKQATGGMTSVCVAHFADRDDINQATTHQHDIHFTFIMEGQLTLDVEGQPEHQVKTGEAFVIPKEVPYIFTQCSEDLRLLVVALLNTPT